MRITVVLFSLCSLFFSCAKKEIDPPAAVLPIPTENQLAWHEMELNAFVHFTTNTFTGKEWGYGDEQPRIFNPTSFDAEQWIRTFKEVGFKGVILTCKHHDGFCLWPTQYSEHSVKNSPWQNGQGDVVAAVSQACKKHGLKFGIYLSPWDRNHQDYGTPTYIDYYRNQLAELLKRYGPVFEMWFDGANGGDGFYGGKREKRTIDGAIYYDWPTTLKLVEKLEPKIIFFSDAGPGVRWVGNEKGIAGETNWNSISTDTLFAGKAGINELLNKGDEKGNRWIPAEVDVSIRKGWFYHPEEDSTVKSAEELFEIYLTSVGRGSTLLLNVPPDTRGLLHETDVEALKGFRKILDQELKTNLAFNASVEASSYRGKSKKFSPAHITDGDKETYWTTNDDELTGSFEIDLGNTKRLHYVVLQEYIKLGQRVKNFTIEIWKDNAWQLVVTGTTIGYKRIIRLEPTETNKVRIKITDARVCPVISSVEIF